MIYSRKYSRNFIPLKQDNQNYSLDFRPALGKCLIEIKDGKGKITVYAQGIKPDNQYSVELMCFEKGNLKNASIGNLSVDSSGKGEIKADFDPENVLNTGNKIEDFNIVALIVNGLDKVVSSLVGYVGNEVNWRDKYVIPKKECNCPDNSNNSKPIIPIIPLIPTKPTKPAKPAKPEQEMPSCPEMPEEMPSCPEMPTKPTKPNYTELEKGLIQKAEGLIEREKGLIEREKGLIYREENLNAPVDLADLEKDLFEKEQGLLEKEQGLAEKEKGLFEKEKALNQGYLPSDADYSLRNKEKQLINIEKNLIQTEYALIMREQNLMKKLPKPKTDLEKALREKQAGLLIREIGLLEREKGLIEKEEGLFEKEDGLREKKSYENNTPKKDNKTKFKEMLDKLKEDIYNSESKDNDENDFKQTSIYEKNEHIEYIKQNNMRLNPFNQNDDNIKWFRISPYELSNFEGDIWKYSNNPFVYNCYRKFNHLMLGIKNEQNTEKYILGIPCKYKSNFSISQFEKFMPLDNSLSINNIKDGEYGYRLLEI